MVLAVWGFVRSFLTVVGLDVDTSLCVCPSITLVLKGARDDVL